MNPTPRHCWLFAAGWLLLVPHPAWGQQPREKPLVPDSIPLSQTARQAVEAAYLTDDERKDLRVFHGVWETGDLDTSTRQAIVALNRWEFDHPSLRDESVPIEIRAEAMSLRGELQRALDALAGVDSFRASRIRAEALEQLGEFGAADQVVDEPVRALLARTVDEAPWLTEGVRALIVRSRLRGQPARDYQTMLNLLARARGEIDRLYWPAVLTEANLLLDKDNIPEAITALHEVLGLNPRSADAWYLLGGVALGRFDFDAAATAERALRDLNPSHPLAELLLAESRLIQNDPDQALSILNRVIGQWPRLREAYALRAAAIGLTYDEEGLQRALDAYDELSPGSALAYYKAGEMLSFDRQYELAADLLNEAKRRQPKWPAPQIELALLELQSGRDALALAALRDVRELDRFNKRVANSLHLLEEVMRNFTQMETDHFIVRYSPETGDRVVADLMAERLEEIHRTVAGRFQHSPDRKTIIELMPNHKWFAVRISGMPFIHTIAASTGPVIAMEVPREGPPQLHLGTFDWPRVVQHEYTHTITLSQTHNRIPHWLTEAAAVSMEEAPRDLDKIVSLVAAYRGHTLFELDEINWAFIRPKRPGDRSLAYNQGHWMVEFMNERFGDSALIRLLGRYFDGEREETAIATALGVSREEFFDLFMEWAGEQIAEWGYAPEPSMESLEEALRQTDPALQEQLRASRAEYLTAIVRRLTGRIGRPGPVNGRSLSANDWPPFIKPPVEVSHEQLADWLEQYPDHPDLLKMAIDRALAMADEPGFELVPLLERYAEARPVDPSPHRTLALIWRNGNDPRRAIPHLEELDVREQKSAVYAIELAKLYRAQGDLGQALEKITRAININPYHAPYRETAAAIALEVGDLPLARTHIIALTILEPDRPQHQRRLEAIDRLIARAAG